MVFLKGLLFLISELLFGSRWHRIEIFGLSSRLVENQPSRVNNFRTLKAQKLKQKAKTANKFSFGLSFNPGVRKTCQGTSEFYLIRVGKQPA